MKSAMVTGASTGIGRATALRLDSRGWRVFAGVRREEDAAGLRGAASERLTPLILDVTEPEQISVAEQRMADELGKDGLDGLVNNAGITVPGPLETLPIDDFRRQLEVNLTAQVAVTQAMIARIRDARGRVIFISSIGGRIALPMLGSYHAAKFGLEAVGDVFRQELRPWGISVAVIEPGSIDTPLWERGQREADRVIESGPAEQEALYGKRMTAYREVARRTAARSIAPETVAATVEVALTADRPRARYLVGRDAKVQARLKSLMPTRLLDRVIARTIGS